MLPIKTLEKALAKTNVPGISMAIISKNGGIEKQEVGITNNDHPRKINDTTLFEAASLSKPVFAFIVLKMIECGKFSRPGESAESGLDRPLYEIFERYSRVLMLSSGPSQLNPLSFDTIGLLQKDGNLTAYWLNDGQITSKSFEVDTEDDIKTLLNDLPKPNEASEDKKLINRITSKYRCTPSGFGPPQLRNHPYYKMLTPRLILSHQSGLPNWFLPGADENYITMPGQEFNYSGLAFCFLCDVLETISGKSLEQLAQEIFTELTMMSSSFLPFNDGKFKERSRAIGHNVGGKPDDKEHFPSGSRPNPAASLLTTAEDYAKFLKACMSDPFISKYMFEPQLVLAGKDKKAIAARIEPKDLARMMWGIGIGLQTALDGTIIAFHWGDVETSRAFTAINLQTKQCIVCFTNSANGTLLFQQIAEPIVGNLSALCQWLTHREGLKLYAEPKLSTLISTNLGFFSKLEKKYLIEHRHDHPKLQHEYDKRFGLVLKK